MSKLTEIILPKVGTNYRVVQATGATAGDNGALLIAAQTAAVAGETIVVMAGDYTITSSIGKNGVNWWFAPGATVTKADSHVIYDGGTAMVFEVRGHGVFIGGEFAPGSESAVRVSHAGSDILIECKTIRQELVGVLAIAGAQCSAGKLTLIAEEIRSNDYDGVWASGGTITVFAQKIFGQNDGLEATGGGTLVAHAQQVEGDTSPVRMGTSGSIIVHHALLKGGSGLVESDGLTLANCHIESTHASEAFWSGVARNIYVLGRLTSNVGMHANITIVPPAHAW